MRQWSEFGWYTPAPKRPPPERGIRVKKAGTTWWGERWVEALQHVLGGDSARLGRGRTYARAGRTHDLLIKGGKVTAKVTGSRATPYKIVIELSQLDQSAWQKAIAGLARKAQFSAELLSGQMPKEVDEVFREAGASLFPSQRKDLKTSCSCPDWGNPCKHVAATHYVLGEALDRDPFLLFELRGKTKEQVLGSLRAARDAPSKASTRSEAGTPSEASTTRKASKPGKTRAARETSTHEVPTVTLGKLTAADYDRPRAALPALHLRFDEPLTHGAVLRQLGAPTAWQSGASPADLFAPLVRAAAESARRIALAEASEQAEAPSAGDKKPVRKSRSRANGQRGAVTGRGG